MLHVIIDGYNLIRQVPSLTKREKVSLEAGRKTLLTLLKAYRRAKAHKITVVFDGAGTMSDFAATYREAGITVSFSPDHKTADDIIKELARDTKARAIVVSSDRKVMDYSRSQGCAVVDSVEFFERLKMAQAFDGTGKSPDAEKNAKPTHKRWSTFKKGPSKRLPKGERRNRSKVEKL